MTQGRWVPRNNGVPVDVDWEEVGQIPTVAGPPGDSWENLPYTMQGELRVKIGTAPYPVAGGTFVIESVTARVGRAPIGGAVVLDVNVNGETIYANSSNRPRIAAGAALASVGAHTRPEVADGDYFTVDVDAPGAVPARDLTVVIRLRRK